MDFQPLEPIVSIEDGQLLATTKFDWLGGKYYSFQGIPYAKPPLGSLRFKAPQPAEPWQGIKDATKEGSDCISRHIFTKALIGKEDCLFLNVYTNQLCAGNSQLKPVMVWIHGGGFLGGSGSTEMYGPEFLVSENIVLVTINYRVGLLGFACFADPSLNIPGNAGLKDQVLALKWVQKNISKFGGDSTNVTIFGGSAGGACVHLLVLSPLAKGLFHKAICQSGVALSNWVRGKLTTTVVKDLVNNGNANESEILSILYNLSADKLMDIQHKIPQLYKISGCPSIGPVVEVSSNGACFLSEDPLEILRSGQFNKVPLIIGYNSREGIMLEYVQQDKSGLMHAISDYQAIIPEELKVERDSELSIKVADRIKGFYNGNNTSSCRNIDSYHLIQSDIYMFIKINTAVRHHTKHSICPIYYYRMSVDSELNLMKRVLRRVGRGASHGDDIGYFFKNSLTPKIRYNSIEYISVRRFLTLWTNFAKYGNPNPVNNDALINVTWLPIENNKLNYLDIGENLTVGVNPDIERVTFWDQIYNLCSKAKSGTTT